ncbi:addiction module toxin RelE [Candidatus Woesearchaeota archaeon]|nr:addiction module toxin RelE [Candidatus Woesearchaeota archaeon]
MARPYKLSKNLEKTLEKISKKDKDAYGQILNKIKEIINCDDPEHYKNLRNPLQLFKSVHIKKSFVLVFSYDKQKDFIYFTDYDHHDNIYKKS